MAEVIEVNGHQYHIPSESKTNAGLTTGIIGTALGALNLIGGGLLAMNGTSSGKTGGDTPGAQACITNEDLYNERKAAADNLANVKELYESKLSNQRDLTNAFFDAYQRDVDNSFMLYKGYRDADDAIMTHMHAADDDLKQQIIDTSFNLYKNQRDEKDALNEKISRLQSQVDILSAIRPYQDALINAKIDNNALIADYNLSKRTCRMIEGQVVLPIYPEVVGYGSYRGGCNCPQPVSGGTV